ncbi:MAG: WYL domain-containing protein [Gammaproteobacteria bacterium]
MEGVDDELEPHMDDQDDQFEESDIIDSWRTKLPKKLDSASLRKVLVWRLQFLEFRVYWEGRINRRDLMDQFGISVPQASADLKIYQLLAPENLVYDPRAKYYAASEDFKPQLLQPSAEHYFQMLIEAKQLEQEDEQAGGSLGKAKLTDNWISRAPSCTILDYPRRSIDPDYLRQILAAMRADKSVKILYQSMSAPKPEWRWITPINLASDKHRWHLRAYCHKAHTYKDFLFARILEIGLIRKYKERLPKMAEKPVRVRIGPHSALSPQQQNVICSDYAMEDGEVVLEVEQGLLFYCLRTLGLDIASANTEGATDASETSVAGQRQQLELLNRDELVELMKTGQDIVE